ncbi:MFS transporter [Monashia sp. NPDC004114]
MRSPPPRPSAAPIASRDGTARTRRVPPVSRRRASGSARASSGPFRALRHHRFLTFWSGALASNTGTWLSNLTVPFVLFDITRSALWVGAATALQFLPTLLAAPLGGALADRYDRRRILTVSQSVMALAAVGLFLVWVAGVRAPLAIVACVAVSGTVQGLNMPSWQAFVNDLVPREDLISAVTLNSLQFNAARAIGPALAGVVLAGLGAGWAFMLNAFTFAFVIVALVAVGQGPEPAGLVSSPRVGVVRGFAAAVAYVRAQPGLQVAIAISLIIGLVGNPIFGFTVVFASDVYQVGPVALGILNALLGVGSLIAAPLVAGRRFSRALLAGVAVPLYGLMEVVFGLARHVLVGSLALLVVGSCFLAGFAVANTAMQTIVADHLRARVLAVRIMLVSTSFAIGAVVQGWIADRVGPRATVTGAGLVILVSGLALAAWGRGELIRRIDDPHDEAPPDFRVP